MDSGVAKYGQLVKKLHSDRVDAICIADFAILQYAEELGLSNTKIKDLFLVHTHEEQLLFAINSPRYQVEKVELIRQGLQKIKENGILEDILNKYQHYDESSFQY